MQDPLTCSHIFRLLTTTPSTEKFGVANPIAWFYCEKCLETEKRELI